MIRSPWKTIWQFQKLLNIELSNEPANYTFRYTPKDMKPYAHKNLHTKVHSKKLRIARMGEGVQKQPKCPPTDG